MVMDYAADGTPIVRDKDEIEICAWRRARPAASNSKGRHPKVVEAQNDDKEEDQ